MERKDNQPQSLGICHKLFTFFMENLAIRGLKRVTSGHPTSTSRMKPAHEIAKDYMNSIVHVEKPKGLGKSTSSPDALVHVLNETGPPSMANPVEDLRLISNPKHEGHKEEVDSGIQHNNMSTTFSTVGEKNASIVGTKDADSQDDGLVASYAPKKTVSIREGAEEVYMPKRRKIVSNENLKQSIDLEKEKPMNVPRPLKPILRSTSNINEKSDAFIRRRKESLRSSSNIDSRSLS